MNTTYYKIALISFSLLFCQSSVLAKLINPDDYYIPVAPEENQPRLSFIIAKRLEYQHYRSMELDDNLSRQVYKAYIKALDRNRSIFTAEDINEFKQFETYVDNAYKQGRMEPAFMIFNRYLKSQAERLAYMINRLQENYQDINFNLDEQLQVDREEVEWVKDKKELKELWRKQLKNTILNLKLNEKKELSSDEKIKEKLIKRLSNQLNRLKQTNSEDAFRIYVNALAESYDPHTQYFSPRVSENFDIQMKLSLEGIGAILSEEDGYTQVKRLVPGGPADKAGQLKAGDHIIAVGQGSSGEIVDVVGWRLDDVVQLIRGEKGSTVRLKIIQDITAGESDAREIKIVRNTVNLEEQSAHKDIIEMDHNGEHFKMGVINLPTFYLDFKGAQSHSDNYRSTTRDVKRLITELKKEKIEGLIIDLRNNGGGSLQEVNTLLGLFIETGPTVQIKSSDDETMALKDEDETIVYDGPLIVMVNRLSASASEIFAGAIQDYKRGIVVGSQTFGKGTVQALQPLKHGQLKLTHAKFYRITGDSTQNLGVIPDITFPPSFDPEDIGESSLPEALVWDQISPANYKKLSELDKLLPLLNKEHKIRAEKDPDFTYMKKTMQRLKKQKEKKEVSLNLKKRKSEVLKSQQELLDLENERRKAKKQPLYASIEDMKIKLEAQEKENETKADPENDTEESKAYLNETANILADFISFQKKQPDLTCVSTC